MNSLPQTAATPESRQLSLVLKSDNHMSRRALVVLLFILILGAAARFVTLSRESVDGDEVFSRRVALLPIHTGLDVVRNDLVHPPFYYLLLKAGTTVWGASALGIRLWSLVFGVATLPLVMAIGTRLPGVRYAGFLAAAMIAVNEYHIYYSQEARSYSFYTFLVMLLVFWVFAITGEGKRNLWSVVGFSLIVLLLYTHYVAALYVLAVIVAILVCNVSKRTKTSVALASVTAATVFVPWIITVAGVYRAKHGVGENLDWQGHPSLYDLKQIWASSLGVMEFKGATTLAFCLVAMLSVTALIQLSRRQSLRQDPIIVALALVSILPPLALFVLSLKPFNFPLFGLRHLLPSIIALCLFCCYGLETIAWHFERHYRLLFTIGSLFLLAFPFIPTFTMFTHGPSKIPYETIARAVQLQVGNGRKVYTTWPSGIGGPVDFYCKESCVEPLPADYSTLGKQIVLLYRPHVPSEAQKFQDLIRGGFTPSFNTYYTTGRQSAFGTSMVLLTRERMDDGSGTLGSCWAPNWDENGWIIARKCLCAKRENLLGETLWAFPRAA
jgi:4-amino-4-deoxy-L-arabinose transferase-like glycosyltransferase